LASVLSDRSTELRLGGVIDDSNTKKPTCKRRGQHAMNI
jgi:hypothetical protein